MVGMKGYLFKTMTPKEILSVVTMIHAQHGAHGLTADAIDKPSLETAMSVFKILSEFAYSVDVAQVKAQTPHLAEPAEIFDEATDILSVFKLASQLIAINHVEDFSLLDIWEPNSKRFKALLSGIINFCRYKESQELTINSLKAEHQELDIERMVLVDRSNQVGEDLNIARERHSRELQDMFNAESVANEAQGAVDKLSQQRLSAERLLEGKEAMLISAKERAAEHEQRLSQDRLREVDLRDQIAESPEGLSREVKELHKAVHQQKARLEERVDEKRSRTQRQMVLDSLERHLEGYKDDLARVHEAAKQAAAASANTCTGKEELAGIQTKLEAQRAEEAELDQAVRQTQGELEKAKHAHEDKLQQLEGRRRQALLQHQELQAKRSEEHRHLAALQTQKFELDAEVDKLRRAHDSEMSDLRARLQRLREDALSYVSGVEAECEAYTLRMSGDESRSKGKLTFSPDARRAQHRLGCTPSPQRVRSIRQPLIHSPVH